MSDPTHAHPAVVVQNLGKRYARRHHDRPQTFMEAALQGFRHMGTVESFWALNQVSFTVMPGQMLGVVGHNGAGKSTLLQVLSGLVKPDVGQVQVAGRMGTLLDLGAGFHPDLTGRENVILSAIVGGLTRQEAAQQFEPIVEFSEIGGFIDNPLRTYSSGMQMRLGFAVAIHTQPDVLFVDEFLSVGDLAFQTKCLGRITALKRSGCAIVLISHNVDQVEELCDQVLWLNQGEVAAYGDPIVVASRYAEKMELKSQPIAPRQFSQAVEILAVRLLDQHGQIVTEIANGDGLTIELDYQAHQAFEQIHCCATIAGADGQIYFNTSSSTVGLVIPAGLGQGCVRLVIDRLDLAGGDYFVNAGVYANDWSVTYDYHRNQSPLTIAPTPQEQSWLYPPRTWQVVQSCEYGVEPCEVDSKSPFSRGI
jgi:lipopolysaccharide transport system ATP-binding protein